MNARDDINRSLVDGIRRQASLLGFSRCGVAPATGSLRGARSLAAWLDRGHAGSMSYMHETREQRRDPRSLLFGARSLIVVAASYARPGDDASPSPRSGRVARYAHGKDYHQVLRGRLEELATWLRSQVAEPIETRAVVDTAPLLEREAAMAAGVGFIGKNTMLIVPGLGSYVLLGTLLTSLELPADTPAEARCGRCTRCLDACPTSAFVAPYELDGRRCISYLTIETRAAVGIELREECGPWVFGCDACQEACPYNRPTRPSRTLEADPELAPADGLGALPLVELLGLRSGEYRRLVRGRALSRASRRRLIANAAIAAANAPCPDEALDHALRAAMERAKEPEVESLRWALARREARTRGQ